MNISCIVLAGGKSLRLGHDKVLQTFGHGNLLEEVISYLGPLSSEILIVTAEKKILPQITGYPNLRVITDIYPEKGPLVGIYTGLVNSTSFYNLVIAADMPFLNQALLRYMIQLSPDFDIVMPRVGNLVEPLHAIYTKNCVAHLEEMINQDNLGVHNISGSVRTRYVEAEEINHFDPKHLSFFNINTKADLELARELARGQKL